MGLLNELENASTWLDGIGGGVSATGSAEMSSHNGTAEAHVHGAATEHVHTAQTTANASEHVDLDAVYHDMHNFDVKGDISTQFDFGSTPGVTQTPLDTGKSVFDQAMHPDHTDQLATHPSEQHPAHQEHHPVHHIPDYMSHHHTDAFSGHTHDHHGTDSGHHGGHDSHSGSHSHGDLGHI